MPRCDASPLPFPRIRLKINSGLTKEACDVEFPPGSHVHDAIAGTDYIVGPATERPTNDEDERSM